jgi:flotillin
MMDFITIPAISVGTVAVLGAAFWSRYKTVGPDKAMIVTGSGLGKRNIVDDGQGKKIKIVRGGGAFILPIFQRADILSLLTHKLDLKTPEVYTKQGVQVFADGVAIIKIGGSVEDVATAAEQFLGKPTDALKLEAQEVLEGHLRAILGTLTVEEVNENKDKFAEQVQSVAAIDLKKMGLQIVSFTIKDIRDKHGYLANLGIPQIEAVKRNAAIAEAEASKEARIKQAQAEEEAKKAELLKETNIAEATKEKELKVASFKLEQEKARAEADQAYAIQEAKTKQIAVDEEMKVNLVRKEREIDIEDKEIQRQEKQYDAQIKKKAEADRYAAEQAAEAEKVKVVKAAEASAEQQRLQGIAIAESNKAQGSADAEVIRLRGLAEAEAKEKLAEALNKFGEAAVLEMVIKMLPQLAGEVAKPMANIDKLTVVDSGGGQGATKVSNYVTQLMATAPEMLKSVSGIDLEGIIKGFTNKNAAPGIDLSNINLEEVAEQLKGLNENK